MLRQSARADVYRDALRSLQRQGEVYPCACTRRELEAAALGPGGERIYPGTCRQGIPAALAGRTARAQRLALVGDAGACIEFRDRLQGRQRQDLRAEVGDFVLRRADGLFAYQLAVVVDDAAQGVTHVVRGADLLSSTARQIYLQRRLQRRDARVPARAGRRQRRRGEALQADAGGTAARGRAARAAGGVAVPRPAAAAGLGGTRVGGRILAARDRRLVGGAPAADAAAAGARGLRVAGGGLTLAL